MQQKADLDLSVCHKFAAKTQKIRHRQKGGSDEIDKASSRLRGNRKPSHTNTELLKATNHITDKDRYMDGGLRTLYIIRSKSIAQDTMQENHKPSLHAVNQSEEAIIMIAK